MTFAWGGTPDSSPSVGSSGESVSGGSVTGGGGGSLRSGSLYGVVRIEQSQFDTVCRGFVGAGQRMCVRSDCQVASHSQKKKTWSSLVGDDTTAIFIRGSSGTTSAEALGTVFCTPVLPGQCMRGVDWNEMELSPRTLESWQASFTALRKASSESGEGMDPTTAAQFMETTKSVVDFTMTPRPKKRSVEVETVMDDDDEDGLVTPKLKRREIPWKDVPTDISTSTPTPAVRILQGGAWSNLVENVTTLRDDLAREVADWRVSEEQQEEQVDKLDLKLSVLHELLGKRPSHFGTRLAFQVLDSCVSPFKKELEAFLADTSTDFRFQFVDPTLSLLSRSSRSPTDPGGKWADALQHLQQRLASLEQAHATNVSGSGGSGGMSSGGGSFNWSTGGLASGIGSQTGLGVRFGSSPSQTNGGKDVGGEVGVDVAKLQEDVKNLQTMLKDLKEQVDTDSIPIGSIIFTSRAFCVTWMELHHAASDPHVFVDAISLLSLATSDASPDEERAANQRATTAKVRDKTPYHTAYIASFNLEVPPLLGKGSDQATTTNSRALGAVPRFADFHPPSGREGIHQRILDYVKDGVHTIEQAVGELFAFGTEPSSVAKELLLWSKTFWDELTHWMVRYHAQVQAESEASEQEVWILISHCIRAVFKSLREARASGRASNTPGGMLWGTLKAHRVMQEYRAADFSGHPKIALILHEHLIRFTTPRSKFDTLQMSLNDRLDKMQRAVNQAVSSANKSTKKT